MAGSECDAAYDSLKSKQEGSAKAKGVLRAAGYARGGGVGTAKKHSDEKQDRALVKSMVDKAKIKVKSGGKVDGHKAKGRADKYARGGSVPKGHHTKININVGAGQAEKQQAMQQGLQLGAKLAAAKMGGAPRPGAGASMQARPAPGGPAPMGGGAPMPPAGGGGVPPTMANRGGRFAKGGKVTGLPPGLKGKNGAGPKKVEGVPHLSGGAAGALGRLQKKSQYGTKPKA